ncbi:MAG: hypothetical protein LBP67_08970 [Bacteroidales bacterium]|jgi:hypothetical protein|nr:hypothetical protein [Bacteroidales bacterium]
MKIFTKFSLLLVLTIVFCSCTKTTTVAVKNSTDYQLSEVICFGYSGNDVVHQENIGTIGAGSSSQSFEVDGVEKIQISFKFFINQTYSDRYYTVSKFQIKEGEDNIITIDNDTFISTSSKSSSQDEKTISSEYKLSSK